MKEKIRCSSCGANLTQESMCEFEGQILCINCLDERSVVCDCCGTRLNRDCVDGDDYTTLCNSCYTNYYTCCENCGTLIHNDDAYTLYDDDDYYCRDCYHKLTNRPIKNYNYKPDTRFYGKGNLFYGIELEIDKGGESDENAKVILDFANEDGEKIYCKHDGSIENGFEIVSHAASIDYHLKHFPWEGILRRAIELGYCSHNTSTCGLHIHASKLAFGRSYEQRESTIGRIVFFVEKHWNEIVKFSRRTPDNLNRWAARYATISTTTEETYKKAKERYMGRYVAVNLENNETVEFRLFRGTLNYKTFIATLQLVDEICRLAIMLSDRELESMSWLDFVMSIPESKKELIEYLKTKRLYVNELNTEQEEM